MAIVLLSPALPPETYTFRLPRRCRLQKLHVRESTTVWGGQLHACPPHPVPYLSTTPDGESRARLCP